MKVIRYAALTLIIAVTAAPAWAGLVDRVFPNQSEDAVAANFEKGLGEYLANHMKDPVKPRMYIMDRKQEVFVEVTAVKDDETTWQTLVHYAWFPEKVEYAWSTWGKEYTFKIEDLPPSEVAAMFDPKRRPAGEIVGLACWLAKKGELMAANEVLAGLATKDDKFKADVDAWLCEKNNWKLPDGGLKALDAIDLDHHRKGVLFLTDGARKDYLKDLEDEAKKQFKELERLQGGDLKSTAGHRRKSPCMRLDMLAHRIELYKKAYAETAYIKKKRTEKDLEAMAEAVRGDATYIETEKFKAERLGIDGDWAAAAAAYDRLLWLDPLMPDLVTSTAQAYNKAAGISDGARKADDPKAAQRAAELYEQLLEIYPKALAYHNYAGMNWLAAGDKKKAKAHHEEVVHRTDNRTDLSENEKKNREFAEKQLKLIG